MDRQLKTNILSLSVLQVGNYLVPLITLPYLTRVLGVDGFGQVGFATAFTMYFVLFVDWGFNLSSTRDVSVRRADKIARSIIFWETILARLFLTASSAIVLLILTTCITKLEEHSVLYFMGMLQVLASTISTAFYYQGIEQMGAMALINLAVRLSAVPLLIIFVQKADDVVLAFAVQTSCFFIASLLNFILLLRSGELSWARPSFTSAYKRLVAAFPLFLSSAGTSLYTNSNAVILGFVASEAAVGYFVAGFTLVKAVVGLSAPFAQAVFPRVSHLLSNGESLGFTFIKKMVALQVLLGLFLSIGLLAFAPWGVSLLYGDAFQETVFVVAWLSGLPLMVCLASALGMQILVPSGQSQWFAGVLLMCGILNCILLLPLGYAWGAAGAAIVVLCTECGIMVGMAVGVKRNVPDIWRALVRFA